MTDAKKMALLACEALEDKKASDIKVIDIEQLPLWLIILSSQAEVIVTRYKQWRIM